MNQTLKSKQERLLKEQIIIINIMYYLGSGGIMIKPQLYAYMKFFEGYSLSTFSNILRELIEAKLIIMERTKTVSILMLSRVAIARIKGVETKAIKITDLRSNSKLNISVCKNEYIIMRILPNADKANIKTYDDLINYVSRGNFIAPKNTVGRTFEIIGETALRNPALTEYKRYQEVLQYLAGKTKHPPLSIELLYQMQSKGLYLMYPHLNCMYFVYAEIRNPLTYRKIKADLELLNKFSKQFCPDFLTIIVLVDINRVESVRRAFRQWENKCGGSFNVYKTDRNIEVYPIDIKKKCFKGLTTTVYS